VGGGLQHYKWTASTWVLVSTPTQELPSTSHTYSLDVGFPVAVLPPSKFMEEQPDWHIGEANEKPGWQDQQQKAVASDEAEGELHLDLAAVVSLQPEQQLAGWVSNEQVRTHEALGSCAASRRDLYQCVSTLLVSGVPLAVKVKNHIFLLMRRPLLSANVYEGRHQISLTSCPCTQ